MQQSFLQRLLLVLVSVGWWGGLGIPESQGQICSVLQGCNGTVMGDYGTVSGGNNNTAGNNYDTVGGGQSNTANGGSATVGGGYFNTAGNDAATVGGGYTNTASSDYATVGGGDHNTAGYHYATVSGGNRNTANGSQATVSGGDRNTASGELSLVGGGKNNTASGPRATVSGGYLNTASGFGAMVPGGGANAALGNYSWAGGLQAKAWHKGAFVWADTTATNFPSTAADQFSVRASGGTRIFTNAAATVGVRLLPGSNAWSIASDRALKVDFHDIDKQAVLAKVQQLSIQNWKLKDEVGNVRHVGPVAQDFQAAFGLGSDELSIHTGDADGVALVAIQALAEQNQVLKQQVEELQRQNNQTRQQNAELQRQNTVLQMQMSRVLQQVYTLVQERQSGHRQEAALGE